MARTAFLNSWRLVLLDEKVEAAGRGPFLFPTYPGRSKGLCSQGRLNPVWFKRSGKYTQLNYEFRIVWSQIMIYCKPDKFSLVFVILCDFRGFWVANSSLAAVTSNKTRNLQLLVWLVLSSCTGTQGQKQNTKNSLRRNNIWKTKNTQFQFPRSRLPKLVVLYMLSKHGSCIFRQTHLLG